MKYVGFTALVLATLAALLFATASPGSPSDERIRVACLGDSITAGARTSDPATQSYPARLQRILGDSFEVRNFGRGGATLIESGRPNVWQDVPEVVAFAPHVVVVMLGTNDTVEGDRGNWWRIASFDADYARLLETFAALPTAPRILVCTPTAMVLDTEGLTAARRADLEERQPRLQELCARVRRLVEQHRGNNTTLVDMNRVLRDRPMLLTKGDGVHPNSDGYRVLAAEIAERIRPRRPRPNVLFFLVDDMGWQDTSVPFHSEPTPFNARYRTPAMERLAASGMKFTAAYASCLCSPTRTTILNGQNAARHHVTQWTLQVGHDPSQQAAGMQSPEWRIEGLQPGTPTLPGILRDQGYRTIHVGKAHWGAQGTAGADPRNFGFDVNIAGHEAGGPGSYHGDKDFSAAWRNGDRIWDVPGLEKYHGQEINLTEALTREALVAVEDAVESERPFFLYMAHYAIHAPLEPDRRFVERYREAGITDNEAIYASMIESMDHSLGDILDRLGELGVAEETIVLFASDNGGLSHGPRGLTPMGTGAYTHNAPLSAGKCSAYEGGIRVPMIVSWAARHERHALQDVLPVPAASSCDRPVYVDDFLPTLCAWAGVEELADYGLTLDGHDITGYAVADADFARPGPLVFHYPHFINYSKDTIAHGFGPFSAMRAGQWKVIYFYDREKWELYDLDSDLGEQHDLAAAEPARLSALATDLIARLEEMGAQYPVVTSTGEARTIRLP